MSVFTLACPPVVVGYFSFAAGSAQKENLRLRVGYLYRVKVSNRAKLKPRAEYAGSLILAFCNIPGFIPDYEFFNSLLDVRRATVTHRAAYRPCATVWGSARASRTSRAGNVTRANRTPSTFRLATRLDVAEVFLRLCFVCLVGMYFNAVHRKTVEAELSPA